MDKQLYTIDEFAQTHRICRATVYNLIRAGKGPATIRLAGRTLISIEAATAWRRKMEAESASAAQPVAA